MAGSLKLNNKQMIGIGLIAVGVLLIGVAILIW
jgi:uncharacterized membrane protein